MLVAKTHTGSKGYVNDDLGSPSNIGVRELEDISDEIESFYNKKTETIITLFNDNLPFDVFEAIENLENYPDWIQNGIKSKYRV